MNSLHLLDAHPELAETASRMYHAAAIADSESAFLQQSLGLVRDAANAQGSALVRGEKGQWRMIASAGKLAPLPYELLGDALDRGASNFDGQWRIAPLSADRGNTELLACHGPGAAARNGAEVASLAELLHQARGLVREREARRRRIRRLEAILDIAAQWRQTLDMNELLAKMAEASTRLLDAERASIFLWDRGNKMLIGRPALGVAGGELRIADDTGVVGQVVHSGEPRRVDRDVDQHEIDRRVDKELNFRTETLLCVPLVGASGERFGAFEMINKRGGNFSDDDQAALVELAAHAAVALENTQQYAHLLATRNQMADQAAEGVRLIGECPAVEALRSTVRRVADTDLAILLMGENGTGKEVVAQLMHYLSSRRSEPFVAVNCAALTETLLESELFGHEKGAFTDARETRAGKFELASGGTLFLDEIGDMSLSGQAKLLRVLEEKVVVRVGGSTPIHTDARIIAATNQDLASMVREKKFREDLYFRLNVVTLDLPPLRARGDDIMLLAEHFLGDFCVKARRRCPKFTAAARKRLLAHPWPGNVRELRNLMERLAYLAAGDKIDAEDLAFTLSPGTDSPSILEGGLPLADATKRFQIEYIQKHIDTARGNMTHAAKRLGLHRSNLYRKMRQLGMEGADELI